MQLPNSLVFGTALYLLSYFLHILAVAMRQPQIADYCLVAVVIFVFYAYTPSAIYGDLKAQS